jgi:hypothetical protein
MATTSISEGVGGGLPPQSVQQGVVNTNQANIGPRLPFPTAQTLRVSLVTSCSALTASVSDPNGCVSPAAAAAGD